LNHLRHSNTLVLSLLWVNASCCVSNNEQVQQSFFRNNVSICFINHVISQHVSD
jgi:hypothetical protein